MRWLVPLVCLLASCNSKRAGRPDDAQDPIDFRIVNRSGFDPTYLDWTEGGRTEILGRMADDSIRFAWFHPPCTADCDEIPEGECGCLDCEPPDPVMRELLGFGEVVIRWEGPDVYTIEFDACGCPCARARPLAVPASLVVGLVSYNSCTCGGDCPAPVDGLVAGAVPDGDRICATRFLDLPFEDGEFTIVTGTVCDADWP